MVRICYVCDQPCSSSQVVPLCGQCTIRYRCPSTSTPPVVYEDMPF